MLGSDAVFEDSDVLDFAAHEIARLQKSLWIHEVGNSGRRSRRNHIAGKERHRTALIVLQRKARNRIALTNGDRLFFIILYRWFPSTLKTVTIIRPETVVRWHRAGFCRYWRWKSRNPGGRPPIRAVKGLGAESEEKREPVSDIDTGVGG